MAKRAQLVAVKLVDAPMLVVDKPRIGSETRIVVAAPQARALCNAPVLVEQRQQKNIAARRQVGVGDLSGARERARAERPEPVLWQRELGDEQASDAAVACECVSARGAHRVQRFRGDWI